MTRAYSVAANDEIDALAKHLMDNYESITPPPWAAYTKTGLHTHHPPQSAKWWYHRCASLLRKLYAGTPRGVSRLRSEYGGRKIVAGRPEHTAKGGGSSVRVALQQLEKAGLVKKAPSKGRILTGEGVSLLDKIAHEIRGSTERKA